jgi:hypothetical protein
MLLSCQTQKRARFYDVLAHIGKGFVAMDSGARPGIFPRFQRNTGNKRTVIRMLSFAAGCKTRLHDADLGTRTRRMHTNVRSIACLVRLCFHTLLYRRRKKKP